MSFASENYITETDIVQERVQPKRSGNEELSGYRATLIGVAYRITGDRGLAEDIVQDIFLAVIESPDRYAGASGLKTYLYRMAINRCIDMRRRQRRFSRILEVFNRERHAYPQDTYEIKDLVRRLLLGIDPQFSIPFVLAEVDGMPYEEIAEIRNLPLNTVRTRIFRCREKLRKKLEKMGYP